MERTKLLELLVDKLQTFMRYSRPSKEKLLAECELNHAQMHFLLMVHLHKAVTMSELATRTNTTMGAVTQLVDGLIEKGLLERLRDEKDKRVVAIKFSAAGEKKFEALKKQHMAYLSQLFDVLSDDEIQAMTVILDKLVKKVLV